VARRGEPREVRLSWNARSDEGFVRAHITREGGSGRSARS
jgi:hypothetical protein